MCSYIPSSWERKKILVSLDILNTEEPFDKGEGTLPLLNKVAKNGISHILGKNEALNVSKICSLSVNKKYDHKGLRVCIII